MLLYDYTLEIFKSKCHSDEKGVHCFAHLGQDVSKCLPYLNAVLGGFQYLTNPSAVTFKAQGKLITVHGKKIAVNALKDKFEAEKIIEWLKREINSAWENKDQIEPCFTGTAKPGIIEILKHLPKTNCHECGQPTCMVFATQIAEGAKNACDCPQIESDQTQKLNMYMSQFKFDI